MRKPRHLLPIVAFVALAAACATKGPTPTAQSSAATWNDREWARTRRRSASSSNEIGTGPPPVLFVMDRLCADAGQLTATKLSCDGAIPAAGKSALSDAMANVAPMEFVRDPSSVVGSDGSVTRDGLLVWLGPTKDEKSSVPVGANYRSRGDVKQECAINLRMEWRHGQWVVTGSAGLGGCPA